ncbi:LexA family transcriptional regulator [Pseudodesulfovibrio piezophilus]|uniref:Putative phage repressor n=1 Tax=Pseudodesulfovibrio piezophilus (strain DSM 21447 / JCM 15486 / C1TLV30) TaxID=1322246 RepID=M1WXW4_PSEP2|nr:helix-turn-helix transcriptional regulator [Pseudodesulfovibrio piezophilus]CCH49968.1 putative phage repressor [Pseudodesulfovibrio piezophilus C1TLV30]
MSNGFETFFKRLCSETEIRNQSQLARELEVGRAAVSLAKRKNSVPARWILDLAARYELNPLWLEQGVGLPRQTCLAEVTEGPEAYQEVPKVRARLCAGGGSFETEGIVEGYYSFRADWLNTRGNPSNMVLMEVIGNSMEPEIKEGDMVLIDESRTDVLSGGIYAVGVEDTVMVKRVERLPGTLVLRSDNLDYAPIHLSGDELNNVRVIGKVLWISREYR